MLSPAHDFLDGRLRAAWVADPLPRFCLMTRGPNDCSPCGNASPNSAENVMLPMQQLGRLPQSEIAVRAAELLGSLGLEGKANKLPRQLSGGQSQWVAIARALANDPLLILADEPTGNLDTLASANVQRILMDLARDYGRAVVVVTHDRDFAKVADRVIVMSGGRIRGD
jgi:lipoprotein-releasing system ATP-binding protein